MRHVCLTFEIARIFHAYHIYFHHAHSNHMASAPWFQSTHSQLQIYTRTPHSFHSISYFEGVDRCVSDHQCVKIVMVVKRNSLKHRIEAPLRFKHRSHVTVAKMSPIRKWRTAQHATPCFISVKTFASAVLIEMGNSAWDPCESRSSAIKRKKETLKTSLAKTSKKN